MRMAGHTTRRPHGHKARSGIAPGEAVEKPHAKDAKENSSRSLCVLGGLGVRQCTVLVDGVAPRAMRNPRRRPSFQSGAGARGGHGARSDAIHPRSPSIARDCLLVRSSASAEHSTFCARCTMVGAGIGVGE